MYSLLVATVRVTNGQPFVLSILHASLIQKTIDSLLALKKSKYKEFITKENNININSNNNYNNNNNNNNRSNNNSNSNSNKSNNNDYNNSVDNNSNSSYHHQFDKKRIVSIQNLLYSTDFSPSDIFSLPTELQEVS